MVCDGQLREVGPYVGLDSLSELRADEDRAFDTAKTARSEAPPSLPFEPTRAE